jgi:hypothetical protein
MFPLGFANGKEAVYPIHADGVQPQPADYLYLGLDVVSREREVNFCHSPLDCNGYYCDVAFNRYCLLEQFETAFCRIDCRENSSTKGAAKLKASSTCRHQPLNDESLFGVFMV